MAGFVADKMDRKLAYIVSGFAMALCGAGMAVAPRTPLNFVIFSLIYALTTGFLYATYFAVVLEAIGKGAAATKSQLLGAATNMRLRSRPWWRAPSRVRLALSPCYGPMWR
jgi:MFS family permease